MEKTSKKQRERLIEDFKDIKSSQDSLLDELKDHEDEEEDLKEKLLMKILENQEKIGNVLTWLVNSIILIEDKIL